jgi:hypothetical protein
MNNLLSQITLLNDKTIESCIFYIREQQVMLDSDVAFFFGVTVSSLNRQMRRNVDRFPSDFCFQLSDKETNDLRCQKGTTNFLSSKRRYNPYAYTEEGIITLAGVLKNDIAAKMSVEIARKFIQMRKFILENGDVLLALAKLQNRQIEFENETNRKFDEILKLISKADLPKQAIFSAGQFYDAYEYISSIVRRANRSIILIDPYCDARAFTFLKNKKESVELTVCSSRLSKLEKEEIKKFESQYGKINIKQLDDNHDRFLIIDNEECYQLGASLNYAGKKMFDIIKNENKEIVDFLLKKIN